MPVRVSSDITNSKIVSSPLMIEIAFSTNAEAYLIFWSTSSAYWITSESIRLAASPDTI